MPPDTVNDLLQVYGIPVPAMKLARTAPEAVQLATGLGWPVALKIASAEIVHKSDVGCVQLNLFDETAVLEAFDLVTANGRRACPQAGIEGVYVQPMIPAGQEVIIGAVQDPQFGPMVMFGSGGVEVEQLKDVEFALAPLTQAEAEGLLARTWAGRRLSGYRHLPPADREQTIETLLRLGQLAADWPQIAEIEINPLRVLQPGQGVVALDARARLAA
jgi:acyl-CoA synthetase (NDP forming)